MSQAAIEARMYHIRGRVQGVGYRNFAQREAARLNLTGWTRNLDDGRVQVFAQGSASELHAFEGLLRKGPNWSEVRGLETNEAPPENLRSFTIR